MPPCTCPRASNGLIERPAVVDREEPVDVDVAGRGVDVDDDDVGAEREREPLRIVEDPLVEAGLEAGRDVRDEMSQPGDLDSTSPCPGRRRPHLRAR